VPQLIHAKRTLMPSPRVAASCFAAPPPFAEVTRRVRWSGRAREGGRACVRAPRERARERARAFAGYKRLCVGGGLCLCSCETCVFACVHRKREETNPRVTTRIPPPAMTTSTPSLVVACFAFSLPLPSLPHSLLPSGPRPLFPPSLSFPLPVWISHNATARSAHAHPCQALM